MDTPIVRAEHEEFRKRIEEENARQNHRLNELEDNVKQMQALVASVERLAANMENMLKEQERQGSRLEALEGRDGEKWRSVMTYLATAIAGIIIGALFRSIGM